MGVLVERVNRLRVALGNLWLASASFAGQRKEHDQLKQDYVLLSDFLEGLVKEQKEVEAQSKSKLTETPVVTQ